MIHISFTFHTSQLCLWYLSGLGRALTLALTKLLEWIQFKTSLMLQFMAEWEETSGTRCQKCAGNPLHFYAAYSRLTVTCGPCIVQILWSGINIPLAMRSVTLTVYGKLYPLGFSLQFGASCSLFKSMAVRWLYVLLDHAHSSSTCPASTCRLHFLSISRGIIASAAQYVCIGSHRTEKPNCIYVFVQESDGQITLITPSFLTVFLPSQKYTIVSAV